MQGFHTPGRVRIAAAGAGISVVLAAIFSGTKASATGTFVGSEPACQLKLQRSRKLARKV